MAILETMHSANSKRWQLTGLILWRGGIAFTVAYGFYRGAWEVVRNFDWPWQLTSGTAIAMAGVGLIMLSIGLERLDARKREGNLLDD